MSSETEAVANETEVIEETTEERAPFAILFQLEDVGLDGRKATFDALQELFAKEKTPVSLSLFSRFCLQAGPETYLAELAEALGSSKSVDEKVVSDFNANILSKLSAKSQELSPALKSILAAANKRKVTIGALTALSEDDAQKFSDKLGLDKFKVQMFPFKNGDNVTAGPNTFLKTAKALEQKPRACAVIGGSMAVCKAALSADMRCAAIPDDFTAFQDYSGVDLVLDDLGEMKPDDFLDQVLPPLDI